MERQTGLGKSLEDVLDSLTPVDPDASSSGRVLFEPEDLEQQLDQLMGDMRDLRERVQHLVGLVPDDALDGGKRKKKSDKKKAKKSKKAGKTSSNKTSSNKTSSNKTSSNKTSSNKTSSNKTSSNKTKGNKAKKARPKDESRAA
jgi:hypothetical protein